jgi:hypothetical protein
LTASETLGEARRARADDESLFEAELTDELGAERLNRKATLVRFILDANKAQGVSVSIFTQVRGGGGGRGVGGAVSHIVSFPFHSHSLC